MLSDEELLIFHQSVERVRRVAATSLRQPGDGGYAVDFVANLHRGLDQVAARAAQPGPVPDCRAGCSYCCYVRVEATDPEIFYIARRVRQWPAAQLADLLAKLRGCVAEQRAGSDDTRQACAFLVDDRCSIYEVRPASCRKAHSLSVKQCETVAPEITQNLKLLVDAEALMAGTAAAYQEVGLPASPHELLAAVLAALTDASAEVRWYRSEAVL